MKQLPPFSIIARGSVAIAFCLAPALALATPYATSLTNDAGVVSFRLNQTTGTNDTVAVISSGGTVTNYLQLPSDDPGSVLARGLIVTNLGIAAGPFEVYIKHLGSGVISTNGPAINFNSPRGVAVNTRPGSPYFGWVYVGNSGSGSRGDGMFAFSADLDDILGQGTNALVGSYDFTLSASSPYHCSVAPDDSVVVTDWSDASGNVITMDPLLQTSSYLLKPYEGTAASPVGTNNNHGSISSAVIVGSGENRVLYTMDEDYQTDPASGITTEWNSVWRYDIGDGPLPWTNAPDRKIMSPYLTTFAGQNQKVEVVGNYLYSNQRRSNPPQHSAYITDLNNLMDPSTFVPGNTPWGMFWTSQEASIDVGYSDDVLRDTMTIAVSPDGKWFASIIAAGSATITAPDGSTFANTANDIILIPMTNGVPNIAALQVFRFGGAAFGRDLAFDAAHNLYIVSSGLGILQSLDIGESTEALTSSDGTFSVTTPPTQVSVAASAPLGTEEGPTPAVFTITRTDDDIDNPVTVFYRISGSASNGVDYVALGDQVTIMAGETTTNISVMPVDDDETELSESVVMTITGSGGYSVGFPLSATVSIADNETPQLRILSLSTNIYAANSNDYAALVLRRYGDTNVSLMLDQSSFAFGGTAVSNVDYYLANLPFFISPGVVDYSNNLVYPFNSSMDVGNKTIILTNLAGADYEVANNTATTYLTLPGVIPGTTLFSDDFENDPTGTNWNVIYGTLTNAATDYTLIYDYDYSAGGIGNLLPLPAAPHSTTGDTKGLYMTVNKNDDLGVAAALNLYLLNHTFSDNYALRFDMYLVQNSSSTQQSKNETALFGINHSGSLTNWVRNSVPGTGSPKFESDGIFCSVEADASTTVNFGMWSAPTWTNGAAVIGPTNFVSRRSTTLTQVFKKPPFDAGPAAGGVPANTVINPTPTWVEVELSQVGNTISWKMNNTIILTYLNTNANTAPFNSGTIMLGYNDPWDDIGNSTAGSGEACVIYDNVRVVSLPALLSPTIVPSLADGTLNLTFPTQSGATYIVEWKADLTEAAWTQMGTYAGTGEPITVPTETQPDDHRFFRIRLL